MDADRKLYTFNNWYKPMYNKKSGIISSLFDFDNLDKNKNGHIINLYTEEDTIRRHLEEKSIDEKKFERIMYFVEKNKELKKHGFFPFRLSGDADYEVFIKKNIKNPKMHMFPNFSLLPVTGNLQIVKERRKSLETFLEKDMQTYFMNRTMQCVPYTIWGPQYRDSKKNNQKIECEKEVLKAFLDIFDNLDEYCKNMYFLNLEKIKDCDIDKYWKHRREIAIECGISNKIMDYDIDSPEYI